MRHLLLATLFLSLPLVAQTGTYTVKGTGCPGTGGLGAYCLHNNGNGGTLRSVHNANTFSLEVKPSPTAPTVVLGFELYTQATSAPVTINTYIYDADSAGKPGNTLAKGRMVILPAPGWYKTVLTAPLMIKPGQKFFLSYDTNPGIWFPFLVAGTTGTHYWHSASSTTWSGPFSTVNWAWRVQCPGGSGGSIPLLANTGVPSLGQSMSVDLSQALANTGAVLTLGLSSTKWAGFPLPLDLTPFGAPKCSLFNGINLLFPVTTSGSGTAMQKFAIPSNPALLGGTFYNQWLVLDAKANGLGLAVSGMGVGMVGK